MNKGVTTTLPSNDGYPGQQVAWAKDCRPAFHHGIRAAERWLNGKRSDWLWAALIFERDALPDETDRMAFEVAFISRIQQRLQGAGSTNKAADAEDSINAALRRSLTLAYPLLQRIIQIQVG